MRKIAAILLIFVMAFNLGGYRLVFPLLQKQADRKLEALLDNEEYDESQLIEVKVTMNMPYQQRFTEYERHYGQIEIEGIAYTYVKRKVDGDVVTFKCIPNESKQQLKQAENELTAAGSNIGVDQQGKQQSKQIAAAKSPVNDYDDRNMFNTICSAAPKDDPSFMTYSFFIPEVIVTTPHQPPQCNALLS